jgi:hypothetical protein
VSTNGEVTRKIDVSLIGRRQEFTGVSVEGIGKGIIGRGMEDGKAWKEK